VSGHGWPTQEAYIVIVAELLYTVLVSCVLYGITSIQHWMLENDKYYIVGQDIDVIIILIIIIVWTASMKTLTMFVFLQS